MTDQEPCSKNLKAYFTYKAEHLGRPVRVYLACPYSSRYKAWLNVRFALANLACLTLIKLGHVRGAAGSLQTNVAVFSPITHSHTLDLLEPEEKHEHDFWLGQDVQFFDWTDIVIVLKLPGFEESFGVLWEINLAETRQKEVIYLTIDDIYQLQEEIYDDEKRPQ